MTININLLPWREEQREKNKRYFLIGLGASGILAVAIVIATYLVFDAHISHQQQRNHLIEQEIALYDRKIKEIKQLKQVKAALIARMNVIQQLQENRPEIVHFFDELVKVVPRSIYLLQLQRYGNSVMITGHTDTNSSVSELMQNIRRNFWLNKPVLEEVEEVTDKKNSKLFNQFRLKVLLKPTDKLEQGDAYD